MGQSYQSIVINAPVEKVWAAIRDFHDASWAPNIVTKIVALGAKKGTEVGAKRQIDDVFYETLIEFDDAGRRLAYTIDDGPSPLSKTDVSNYVARISVRPVTEGGGTFVEWSSTWEKNDKAAGEFCHAAYVAALGEMKKSLGT